MLCDIKLISTIRDRANFWTWFPVLVTLVLGCNDRAYNTSEIICFTCPQTIKFINIYKSSFILSHFNLYYLSY